MGPFGYSGVERVKLIFRLNWVFCSFAQHTQFFRISRLIKQAYLLILAHEGPDGKPTKYRKEQHKMMTCNNKSGAEADSMYRPKWVYFKEYVTIKLQ